MRALLFGLLAGFLLSGLRAPLGLDLVQMPAVEAEVAVFWRAIALFVVALGLAFRPRPTVSIGFLAALAAGFAWHALVHGNRAVASSTFELALTAAVGALGLILLARRERVPVEAAPTHSPATPPQRGRAALELSERLGLAVAGAGVALSLEGVARHLRLFGAGLAQDDSLFAIVFLLLVAIGAAAFGWIAALPRARGLSLAVGLAAAAAGGYASLRVVTGIATTRGLDQYLRGYSLDTSLHGTLVYDALIAAACLIVPAFLFGAAVRGAERRGSLASVLAGASVGLLVVPRMLVSQAGLLSDEKTVFSAELVPLGTLVAVAGAALAILSAPGRSALARWSAFALSLALAAPLLAIEVRPQPVLSPWELRPVLPHLTFDSPAGLVSIDPSPGELKVVTLDRRELSPPTLAAAADAQRIALAFEMLPPAVRVRGEPRVLLVGQMTPLRAFALDRAGAIRTDRTGAWHAAMERIEAHLFEGGTIPVGERLPPAEARRRIAAGDYDLVLVPPVSGDAPFVPDAGAPATTTVVRWLRLDEPAWQRELGEHVLLASDGLAQPCVAAVEPPPVPPGPEERGQQTPLVVRAGEPGSAPRPISWLGRRATEKLDERSDESRARFFERLAAASPGTPAGELFAGLARFHLEQSASSPFERPEEAIELSSGVLETLLGAALREENAFVRSLWEGIARVLVVKRDVEALYRYVEPLAQHYAPWPRLEMALALADLESLDPRGAVARLGPLAPEGIPDIELWYLLGTAQGQAGDHAAALTSFERALELRPDNAALLRQRALAARRAGDPAGEGWVNELLSADPDDPELQRFAGPGPYPPPPPGPPAAAARHDPDEP